MGIDAAWVVFPGLPLTPAELARVTAPAAPDRTMLVVRQAVLPDTVCSAIAVFEVAAGAQLDVPDAELAAAEKKAAASGSLAEVVQIAFKLMRKSLADLPMPAERDEGDDDLRKIAIAISAVRGSALLAGVFDHSSTGTWARCSQGVLVAQDLIEGDEYESRPDAHLAQFTGNAGLRVQTAWAQLLEEAPAWAVAEDGRVLDAPRRLHANELRSFDAEPLLF